MKLFDLHCDAIMKIADEQVVFSDENRLHVHLKGLESSRTAAQVFACFVPGYQKTAGQVFDQCNRYIDRIESLICEFPDRLMPATTADHLEQAIAAENRTAVIISLEGAAPLKGDPETLALFYDRGVRLLTFSWDDNEFCGSVFGNQGGLTPKGRSLIDRCRDLGVAVDLSHASDRTFWDVIDYTGIPVAASHSNARAICPNDRNLTDEMIKTIADRGGIIGLVFGSGFICSHYYSLEKNTREKIINSLRSGAITFKDAGRISHEAMAHVERARLDDLARHAVHIIDKGGEECLGLGSDFDGVDSLVASVDGVQDVSRIFDALQKKGIPSRVLEKIASHNALEFFKRVL
jgi:membrane dipeptidase